MNFEHFNPTRIVFGRGALDGLGGIACAHGEHALLITGRTAMRKHGILDRVVTNLERANLVVTVQDTISPDPKSDEVDAAIAVARKCSCDVVVGLGGGSALDAAKAVGVGIGYESVTEIIGNVLDPSPASLPIVAVPTTAGSGAEVTKGSIITDVERNLKSGIRGEDVFPKVAVVDPTLTSSLTEKVAKETGFDALTHAIESYVARKANQFTSALSERALEVLAANLPRVASGDFSAEVQDGMCFAATLGGINVAAASTCLPHRLQQAMGTVSRISIAHGRGLAVLYPAWLELAYPYADKKFDRAASLLGYENITHAIRDLLEQLEMTATLDRWEFDQTDIDRFVSGLSGNVENDPIDKIDSALVRSLYIRSFSN